MSSVCSCVAGKNNKISTKNSRGTLLKRSVRVVLAMISLSLICVASASCGTIFNGTRETIFVDSNPQGATVTADGVRLGVTPCSVQLERDQTYVLLIQANGYDNQTVLLSRKLSAWILLDILFWPGFIVDFITGGAYRFTNDRMMVTLRPHGGVETGASTRSIDIEAEAAALIDVLVSRGMLTHEQRAELGFRATARAARE